MAGLRRFAAVLGACLIGLAFVARTDTSRRWFARVFQTRELLHEDGSWEVTRRDWWAGVDSFAWSGVRGYPGEPAEVVLAVLDEWQEAGRTGDTATRERLVRR